MKLKNLPQRLAALPEEAQQEVADFIAGLEARYASSPQDSGALRDEPFVGCWKDRDDLTDSTAWVRRTRKREWRTSDA